MGNVKLSDILLTPLRRIQVPGGDVLHALKKNESSYIDFGEAYFSLVDEGAVKAWKKHLTMTLNLIIPIGTVKFVFIDNNGNTRIEHVGEENYCRLTVPPGIWFGFKGIGAIHSLILNIADIIHAPDEVERLTIDAFNFDWNEEK
jgi:dTDP-4-dehydrorhamnose 3,5-epimerase